MSRLDATAGVLLIVGLLAVLMLYGLGQLTFNGLFNAASGVIIFCVLLGKIGRPPKNSN
jgi:hypothetical protein